MTDSVKITCGKAEVWAWEEGVQVAATPGVDVPALVEVLKLGSAGSFTLSAINQAITVANVEHLRQVELLDMELFAAAMRDSGVDAVTVRAVAGAGTCWRH
jgi:3-hydroxyisobutyrate dehydrogenase-like beta-hydroxyacid dehydrogenase